MATIDYDNIQLNLTSAFNDKGAEEAIDNLGDIKKGLDNLDSGNVKEAAQDFRDFADAVNSVSTRSLDDIVKGAIKRANIPRASSLTDEEIENGRTIEWSGETSSAIESAKELKQALVDVQENARTAYEDLYAYLSAYPKTSNSYLKNQMGFDDDTIAHVRQDLYIASVNAKETASGVGQIGKEAKKSLSPIEKIAQRLKNLVIYRILRSIVSGMANAIKEGFANLESWDRSIGMTGFAESMDRARESLLVLKNSLAVVGAPFLEYLIGILQKVAQLAMAAANAISRFFAILGGKQTYRAVIWADTIAESEKKAGGAAKKATEEFKKQLLAFDEINNITAQNPSGSGGGGSSGGGGGYTDMFEERAVGEVSEVESKLKAIWDWIRKCAEQLKEALTPLTKIKDTIERVVIHTGEFLGKLSVLKKPLDTIWQGVLNVVNAVAGFTSAIIDFAGEVLILFEDVLGVVIEIGDELGLWQEMADDAKWKLDLVADVINALRVATQQATAVVEFLGTTMGNLWKVIKGKQSLTEFKQNTADAFQTMQTKIQEASDSFESKIGGAFNKRRAINFDTQGSVTPVEKAVEAAKRALNSLNGYKPHISIDVTENVTRYVKEFTYKTGKFAEGGYPETGQMFVAREAGPELVGTIGGQTAVVNNSDIVASVSQGVAQAVASVLGGGQQVNVTLEGDAKNLFKVVQREGRAYSARTGQPALA